MAGLITGLIARSRPARWGIWLYPLVVFGIALAFGADQQPGPGVGRLDQRTGAGQWILRAAARGQEDRALAVVVGERGGPAELGGRLGRAALELEQVGPNGRQLRIVGRSHGRGEGVEDGEARRGTEGHRHGDGPIELDHRRRREGRERRRRAPRCASSRYRPPSGRAA